MNTPEQRAIPSGREPDTLGNERSCLELMLRLQPFPCLVVETETARPVLSNEEARRMLFDIPEGPAGPDACYATDADGGRHRARASDPLPRRPRRRAATAWS